MGCCIPTRACDDEEPETKTSTQMKTPLKNSRTPKENRQDDVRICYDRNDAWDRNTYEGEIIKRGNHLIRNGFGVLTWKDGRVFEGRFQEDMAHGEGLFYILPQGIDGHPSCYQELKAAGKQHIPTKDNPDRQEWNYGVRCFHGTKSREQDRYAPKSEDKLPIFRLPYEPSKPRVLSSGPLGHREAGDGEYAWDYGMPIGSEVLAVLGGKVLRFASHFPEGRPEPRFRGKDNFVVIKHDDGTLGTYCHLLQNGIKVDVDQRVDCGDVIGESGNSGYTSGPHLHFHVAREVDPQMFIQIPGRFTGDESKTTFICDKVNVCYGVDGPISDVYEGEDVHGVPQGHGVLHRADGAVYTGQWEQGKMHRQGHLQYGETDRLDEYRGEFNMGMRHGEGTLTWSDGRRYTGEWKDNQINGKGTLEYTKNDQFKRCKYAGDFLNDMRHGHGRLEWGDGRWYEGPWKHDAVVHR